MQGLNNGAVGTEECVKSRCVCVCVDLQVLLPHAHGVGYIGTR